MDPRADAGGQRPHARGRALRWPVLCWVLILTLIGVVQLVRAEWFDAAVFLIALMLVVISALLPQHPIHGIRSGAIVISATVLAAVVALLPRHSVGMVVAVLVTGVAALVAAWPGAASERRAWVRGPQRLAVAWAIILVIGCLWELAQFIVGRIAPEQPSFALSDLVDPLLDTAFGKVIFAAAWLSCGAFLVLRGRGRSR